MKKIFLFAAMAVMGVSIIACSSDDNNSTPDYKSSIQGVWKDSKTIFLDKDNKVIGERPASNNDGCGINEKEFKGDVVNVKFYYKSTDGTINECRTDESTVKFEIVGKKISFIHEEEDTEEYEIIEMTNNKLVVLDTEVISEGVIDEEEYPKETVYAKYEFVKK